MIILLGLTALATLIGISYVWASSIDYMNKHHSDYDGDDLFGEPYNKKQNDTERNNNKEKQ